jgi:hypothetical protein
MTVNGPENVGVKQPVRKATTLASASKSKSKADSELSNALSGGKNTPLANFGKYQKAGRLTLDKCGLEGDFNCKDEYAYHPDMNSPQTCGQVNKDLNLPTGYLCEKEDQPMLIAKRIDADALKGFVGAQK